MHVENPRVTSGAAILRIEKGLMDVVFCFYFWTGFTDGSVVLTKGDITRDRHSKTLTLHEGTSPVTGLAFRQVAKVTHLFVATLEKVHVSSLVS